MTNFAFQKQNKMAYGNKIPVQRLTMSLIKSDGKSCIIDELRSGYGMRPYESHKSLPEAAPRVADVQLKEMVGNGSVDKATYP